LKKIITIIGPTAIGKTTLSIELAKLINGQIVGLDSRQIYKGMSIGTAQPTELEKRLVKHHLIGFREPWESISAGEYSEMVIEISKNITKGGFSPIISGGAGLYYRALTSGIFDESTSNIDIRLEIEKEYDLNPILLYEKLKEIDPDYAKIVHINNKKRLVRALEIYKITGVSPSKNFEKQKNQQNKQKKMNLFTIILSLDREIHRARIRSRTLEMINDGWIKETKRLIKIRQNNNIDLPALNSIGYEQIVNFLNGEMSKEELVETIINKTWQYARKQVKWFRNEDIDLTIDITNLDSASAANCICDLYSTIK
jgi:tRNA dimethylallyltransferase